MLTPDGSVARAFPLRGEVAAIMAAGSGTALVAGTMLPEGITKEDVEDGSWPYLHVVDRHGAVLRSFLPRDAALGGMGARIVATAGERVWVATIHRPTLEEWSLEGERLRTIDRGLDCSRRGTRRTYRSSASVRGSPTWGSTRRDGCG